MTSFNAGTSLASALVVLTTFLMMRRLTRNTATALVAAFFSAFIPASFRMFGELQKNAFGVALAPLAVFFFWRGMEEGRRLDLILAGVALGAIGLTHELVFGVLIIVYLSYLGFLLAHRRRIPWRELKAAIVIAVPVALVCGIFYIGKLGAIASMAGEREHMVPPGELGAAELMLQGEPQPPGGPFFRGPTMSHFYDEYIGCPLFVLAALGVGVTVYRRRPADLFLLTWVMAALAMAQSWVIPEYRWRFPLMLATPIALLAAVGLVEGIGAFLWGLGKHPRAPQGRNLITTGGRVVTLLLLAAVLVYQTQISNTYAWTGEMLQPTITMGQYLALVDFHRQYGSVYAFRAGFDIYWPDAVGLKADIQGGAVVSNLSNVLMGPEKDITMRLAVEWYWAQDNVGDNIYALASPERGETQVLKNTGLFELVFERRPALEVYALREDFVPPEVRPLEETSQPRDGKGLLLQEPPPEWDDSPLLKILLAPVYLLRGSARFMAGVPLTIFMWVFLLCLMWEAIRRTTGETSELIRKIMILTLTCVLVLASVAFVRGYWQRPALRPPPEETEPLPEEQQPPPGGEEHFDGISASTGEGPSRSMYSSLFWAAPMWD
jgi:hypothetical protein